MPPAATPGLLAVLRRLLLDGTPLHRHLMLDIIEHDAVVAVRLPDTAETKNHLGTQGAPALFAVGDCACATAVIAAFGPEPLQAVRAVVGEALTRFRRPATGAVLAFGSLPDADAAVAALDAVGQAAFDVTAELTTEEGHHLGELSLTWHLTAPRSTDA